MIQKSRGRPKGRPNTKGRILEVAVRKLTMAGAENISLRTIAEEAGVDPASIIYHFGSKHELFRTVLALQFHADQLVETAFTDDGTDPAYRIAKTIVEPWESEDISEMSLSLCASVIADPDVLAAVQAHYEAEIVSDILKHIDGPNAEEKAAALVTVATGMIFGRYLFKIRPMSRMTKEEFVAAMAPALRGILDS